MMRSAGEPRAPIHPIRVARAGHDIDLARSLFREYAAWLGVDLCFQGFEDELAALPGKYAPPLGLLLIAGPPGDAVGCAALRPLPSPSPLPQPPEPQPPEPRSIHVPGIPERGSSVVPGVGVPGVGAGVTGTAAAAARRSRPRRRAARR